MCVVDHIKERIPIAAFIGRAVPGVVDHVRCQVWVWIIAVQIGGGDEPLEALAVCGGCTVTLVHVAASNPARSGSHTDLLPGAIIAYHGSHCVCAVPVIVTGFQRVGFAYFISTVDGVVPVIVVVSRGSIPTAVLAFKRWVIPIVTGILPTDYHSIPSVACIPNLGSSNLRYIPLNCRGGVLGKFALLMGRNDWQIEMHGWVGVYVCHIVALC